jgi:hypothetical protein
VIAHAGASPTEHEDDERRRDWVFLLSIDRDSDALVVGSGLDAEAKALEAVCRSVRRSADANAEMAAGTFDLVAIGDVRDAAGAAVPVRALVRRSRAALRPGGEVVLTAENASSLLRRFGWRRGRGEHGVRGYKIVLEEEGFGRIRMYAPVPFPHAPLFYVPLDGPGPVRYFLEDLFDLVAAVSPEARARYRVAYAVARAVRRAALILRLEGLAARSFPALMIVARAEDDGAQRHH